MKFNPFVWGAILVFYLIPFQDLGISFLFLFGFPIVPLKILLILKELIVIILGASVVYKKQITSARLFLILFIAYSLISIFFSKLPVYNTILGLRTYLLLLFSFVLGEQVSTYPFFYDRFMKHLNRVFLLVLCFSLLEYFILPMSIWKFPFPIMQMKREVANLATPNEYYDFGYPVNAMGELTRRMLGPFDEPLYMAYFSIIMVNFYLVRLINNNGESKYKTILGSVLVLLTQTRAIILGYILSVAMYLSRGLKLKVKYVIVVGTVFLLLIPVSFFYIDWLTAFVSSIFDSGGRNKGHIEAYVVGLKLLLSHPFGSGIGSASSIVGFSDTNNATENTFINIGLEIGLIGMVAIFCFFVFLCLQFYSFLLREKEKSRMPHYLVVASAYLLIIQFTFSGLVAPHILTARILIPFMIVMGWAYGITKKRNKTCE